MYQKGKITKWPSFNIYICHPLMLRFLFCKFCCNSKHDEIALGTCMFDCKFVLHKSSNVNFACLDLSWSLVKLPMDGVTCRSKHRRRRRGRKWRATPTSCSARSWRVSWEYWTVFVFNRHVPEVVNVFYLSILIMLNILKISKQPLSQKRSENDFFFAKFVIMSNFLQ